ncbi:SIMPL domain-containing protein [Promicromonospora panici]|uniref:SIMPL domain-containing protein n=1 Tax=Promicromonospora panici TaxID=2219658 RepID=UPI00101DF779|nr:SIMPL domain-containing protein [Promicromonospora panici]
MTRIAVEGQATRTHPAERGTVNLHVAFSGTLRNDVVDQVARTHTILVEQARAHVSAGAAEKWDSDSVHSYVYDDRVRSSQAGGKQRVRRFRASARLSVTFRDFEALSTWLADIMDVDGVEINRISWDLTDETRKTLLAEARVEAAEETAVRAQSYADALGLGPVAPVAIYEAGLRGGGNGGNAPMYAMRASAGDYGAAGGAEVELQPRDIDVDVTLSADYEAGVPAEG